MFDIKGDTVASLGNIAQSIGQIFYDTITSEPATNIGAGLISAFTYAFMGVEELSAKYTRDVIRQIERTITENQAGITQMFIGLLKSVEPVVSAIASSMKSIFEKANKVYDEHIKPTIDKAGELVSSVVGKIIDTWNDKIQPILEKIGTGFADTISNHIEPAVEKLLDLVGSIYDYSRALYEALEPIITLIIETFLNDLAPLIERIGEDLKTFFDTVSDIVSGVADIIKGIIDVITGIINGDMTKIIEGFSSIFNGVLEIVVAIFTALLNSIINILTNIWNIIVSTFQGAWDGIVSALGGAGEWFATTFQGAWDNVVTIFSGIGAWFTERWNETTTALANVGTWFTDMFQKAWTGLTNIFSKLGTWFGERWNDVTTALSNVATWFGNIFKTAFEAVKNAFSTIGSFFSGVWTTVKNIFVNAGQMVGSAVGGAFKGAVNAVLGTIENVVNGFIGMINGVLSAIRKLPGLGWVGSVGTVSLPRLARGGIVDSPTVAMIGEAGKEVVMPLENTGFLQTMGRIVGGAVVNALGGGLPQSGGFSGSGDIVIQIGGHEFGRVAIQEINREQERAGQVLLNI